MSQGSRTVAPASRICCSKYRRASYCNFFPSLCAAFSQTRFHGRPNLAPARTSFPETQAAYGPELAVLEPRQMASNARAASSTVRPKVPTTSKWRDSGMTPSHEVKPKVGLIPTTPFRSAGNMTWVVSGTDRPSCSWTYAGIGLGAETEGAHIRRNSNGRTRARSSRVLGQVERVPALATATRIPLGTVQGQPWHPGERGRLRRLIRSPHGRPF